MLNFTEVIRLTILLYLQFENMLRDVKFVKVVASSCKGLVSGGILRIVYRYAN